MQDMLRSVLGQGFRFLSKWQHVLLQWQNSLKVVELLKLTANLLLKEE